VLRFRWKVHADASNFVSDMSKQEAYTQVLDAARGLFYDQRNWVSFFFYFLRSFNVRNTRLPRIHSLQEGIKHLCGFAIHIPRPEACFPIDILPGTYLSSTSNTNIPTSGLVNLTTIIQPWFLNTDPSSNLSNAASLLWHALHALPYPSSKTNWAGFYVIDPSFPSTQLILGPFQGKVACQTIRFGRGVCGTAVSTKTTQLVADVEKFPGHIACDAASASEIVVPILQDGKVSFLLSLLSDLLCVYGEQGRKCEIDLWRVEADCNLFLPRLSPLSMSIALSRMALTTKTRSTWKSLQS
jgi:putative methionine-R-sulfoxide reductase with GAF domain